MRKINLVCFLVTAFLTVAACQETHAQRPAHYYPARPTFSTYLLYRQLNATGIPNYYQYVRPATQFRDFIGRSEARTTSARQTLSVEGQVSEILDNQLRQRATTGIGQASVPARFNDTSHFYGPRATRRR